MVYPLSPTKLQSIISEADQTNILNLLPDLQDPTSNTGSIITHTCEHTFLDYTDNFNPAHYNFTAFCMWNNGNYTDKCYTNVHT